MPAKPAPVTPAEPELKAIKFDLINRGALALIKLPFRQDTNDFAIATRSIQRVADDCQITCLFFGLGQEFESMVLDRTGLERLGLKRVDGK